MMLTVLRGLGAASLDDLAAAITRMEGSCPSPAQCRNNNPGNLRAYSSTQPVDSRGIRIFPDYESGYTALLNQERINISKGLTLNEFIGGKDGVYPGYAPAADSNDPDRYARNVSQWTGLPTDVPLAEAMAGGASVDPGTGGGGGVGPITTGGPYPVDEYPPPDPATMDVFTGSLSLPLLAAAAVAGLYLLTRRI